MTGIDVTAAAGEIGWEKVRAAGVDFVMIRAGGGRAMDVRFGENLAGADRAGIAVGVFHTLSAADLQGALEEAELFLSQIRPHREKIRLWACCRAESGTANVLYGFLRRVQAAGFSPMLCAPPELVRSLPDGGRAFPLWLLSWNVPEYRAMQFCPRIWQYDSGFAEGVPVRIPRNRGYFGCRMPDVRRNS